MPVEIKQYMASVDTAQATTKKQHKISHKYTQNKIVPTQIKLKLTPNETKARKPLEKIFNLLFAYRSKMK